MDNNVPSNENLFYSDLKTRLQRVRREERLYIRLTKNEKERLRQFTGKVGMPLQIPIEVKPETSLGRNKF